ncbi:ATP-binding protein [Actinopolymorpha sp. B11F2]|uniref:AlbA family DNA-binding domain-containing protein n=1 Tax=Actinopolymorpha sp. B11F2 TaxID=3160862 RepID=UPI0032E3C478
MVALRSRRLERLLGARIDAVSHAQIADLVTNAVTEAYDLDFKAELYGNADKDKRACAGDVAALANTAGGVIVLGVAEDDQAKAAAAPGVALSDGETRRIRQIVASLVAPVPIFDIEPVEDPERAGRGFLLIAVPRSPSAPHAVLVNEGLRFPRRNGTTTTYLSEPEVAAAYRNRFAGLQSRFDELASDERDLLDRLDTSEHAYVVVTLIPDLAGGFTIDTKAMRDFEAEIKQKEPLILRRGFHWYRVRVGNRRLVADGTHDTGAARWLACELRESGAGSFAAAVALRGSDATSSQVDDEHMVNAVWSGLRFLARHARDRAAAGGNATARATVWPVSAQLPAELVHRRFYGMTDQLGREAIASQPVATGVFDIDDLAENGPPLVSATYAITTGLVQHFGYPEALQVTRDGSFRIRYWSHNDAQQVRDWATSGGVEVSDQTVG